MRGAEPIALIVQPPFLERIELYNPQMGDARSAIPLVSGRDITPDGINHVGLSSGFIIDASTEPRILYLRISSSTTLTANVSVMPLQKALNANRRLGGILAVYVAFLSAVCLWGLVNWIVRREGIYGFFVLRQCYSLLFFFVFFGLQRFFLAEFLSVDAMKFNYAFIIVTVIAATGYFDLRLLSGFGASLLLRRVFGAILFLPLVSVSLLLLGARGAALHLNVMIVNVIMLLTVLLAFSVRDPEEDRLGPLAIWIIRIGFMLMTLVIVLPALMHLKIVQTSLSAVNFIFFHAILSTSILVALLSIRARRRDFAAQQALLLVQIKERERHEESLRRNEKEKFLSMLTHELRNPLAVIRLIADTQSANGKAIEKAALDMANVIERVEQSERLESQQPVPNIVLLALDGFLTELLSEKLFSNRVQVVIDEELYVRSDAVILKSLLRNLLDNAIKYSPADAPVLLIAASGSFSAQHGVRLDIVNEVGEAGAPDPEKLYTKYYRSQKARHQPGSGLGLFLVASWVKALGGQVDYQLRYEEDGRQSVLFSLWIPS